MPSNMACPICLSMKASNRMKCHLVVEGKLDAELFERLFADWNRLNRPRIVVAGGKMAAVSRARSILILKRQPVAVVLDADTAEPILCEEQRADLEYEMRAAPASAEWRVFMLKPEMEVLFFSVPSAIERVFGVKLGDVDKFLADYSPRAVLAGLAKSPQSDSAVWSRLISDLTEAELTQIRQQEQVAEIRDFLHNATANVMAANTGAN